MKTLTVALPGREYDILIGRGLLAQAGERIRAVLPRASKLAVVTDSNVGTLYSSAVLDGLAAAGFQAELFTIPAGEESKNPSQLARLWEGFMEFGLTRTDGVVALGGGVVGDLAGFAAATILRGVAFVQIPTTLLAQVDSSVGGKVAVDLKAGKNLAGAFYQPKLVLMDPDVLDTLPLPVFMAGMAEVLKYGCIWDADFFDFLAARPDRKKLMPEIEHILYTCCDIKRQVVMDDELDTGIRMILNFGHTLGHAYELAGHYTEWSHGEAVAAGMCAAARIGMFLSVTPENVSRRIADACAALGLPTDIICSKEDYSAAIGLDKKGTGEEITLILLDQMGRAVPYKTSKSTVLELVHLHHYLDKQPYSGGDAMTVTITPAKLSGAVTPPPSKSQTHRALIAAALADGESVISNVAFSQDIEATLDCLEQLGARFVWDGGSNVTVQGMSANTMSPLRRLAYPHLRCGESGSTLRFLIPVALAVRGGGIFTGRGRLMERPLTPYFDLFDEKGIFYEQKNGLLNNGILTVTGTLTPGEYRLPGNVSSQFVTGLLYALPLLAGDSEIVLTSPLESRGYVDMTLDVLADFGITVEERQNSFFIPGRQLYQPRSFTVEADWSQAGFWYAAKFLGSPVAVTGVDPDSAQGDRVIAEHFAALAQPGDVDIDVSGCPDLAPPLAAMAAGRAGQTTHLVNAARLRIKESDRLASVTQVLGALGADVTEGPDSLTIRGKETLAGDVKVDSFNDHRIAMMAAIAATRCEKPVTITGAQCVAKSYPDFWEEYERLGGKIRSFS